MRISTSTNPVSNVYEGPHYEGSIALGEDCAAKGYTLQQAIIAAEKTWPESFDGIRKDLVVGGFTGRLTTETIRFVG
jgi:hypothetical protein